MKVFSRSSKAVMGSFPTAFDIQQIAVNNDFIFTATKCGIIEVWLKERVTRVASIKMGSKGHAKITSLASDKDGGMLFAGSSDGKIQVRNSRAQIIIGIKIGNHRFSWYSRLTPSPVLVLVAGLVSRLNWVSFVKSNVSTIK